MSYLHQPLTSGGQAETTKIIHVGAASKSVVPHMWILFPLVLSGVIVWGGVAWGWQILHGIGVVGKSRPVFWGAYIASYIFWIGVSCVESWIGAFLVLSRAKTHPGVQVVAALSALLTLGIGALFPLIHLGRPSLFYTLMPAPNARSLWPNFNSPLLWDFLGINTCLLGNGALFCLSLLQALSRSGKMQRNGGRQLFQKVFSSEGGKKEREILLDRAIRWVALLVIPSAMIPVLISIQLVSSLNGLNLFHPWQAGTLHSLAFGAGVLMSGTAALFLALRLSGKHFSFANLVDEHLIQVFRKALFILSTAWFVLTVAGIFTTALNGDPVRLSILNSRLTGQYAPLFWWIVTLNFALPMGILTFRRYSTRHSLIIISLGFLLGVWMERLLQIISELSNPLLSFNGGFYQPSWIELRVVLASFALYFLLLWVVATISRLAIYTRG